MLQDFDPTLNRLLPLNGATLWVAEQGQGLPVVLISGGPGCCDYLEPVATLITSMARTIRFDPRGCGRSSPTPPYDLDMQLVDLEALRTALGYECWVVLGHSWGADVALAYALRYPDATQAILYLCGRGLQNDADWKAAYRQGRDAGREPPLALAYPPNPDVNQAGNQSWNAFLKQPRLWQQVAQLTVPMLAVVGSEDIRPSWPVEQVAYLKPNTQFERLEGAGHYLWLTHCGPLQARLQGFLMDLDAPVRTSRSGALVQSKSRCRETNCNDHGNLDFG